MINTKLSVENFGPSSSDDPLAVKLSMSDCYYGSKLDEVYVDGQLSDSTHFDQSTQEGGFFLDPFESGDVEEVIITQTHVSELLRMDFTIEHVFMTLSWGESDSRAHRQDTTRAMILTLD